METPIQWRHLFNVMTVGRFFQARVGSSIIKKMPIQVRRLSTGKVSDHMKQYFKMYKKIKFKMTLYNVNAVK